MRVLLLGRKRPEVDEAARLAAARGAAVERVAEPDALLVRLRAGQGADLLLADVEGDIGGLAERLRQERIHLPIVAYGIGTEPRAAVAAIRAGAREFLPLPPEPELIAAILETVSAPARELVVDDPATRAVLDLARRYALADACVLLTGESGTGKEMVARFLHAQSRRARAPFVAVNCAAIPENLLESELFGHEKGAFTGAVARRIGKFEEANGGTLLLDEISEMEPRLQAKLLRAIQEREIDRVGGTKPVKIDIRLIATSNRDLEDHVAKGGFRDDLLFRLSVLTLRLPPLRERPRDIVPLARHFAERFARTNALPPPAIDEAARARLLRHHWRGNVRELENCLHRAVILAGGGGISAEHIQLTAPTPPQGSTPSRGMTAPAAGPAPGAGEGGAEAGLVGSTVAEVERTLILGTLRHTLGNRTQAATMLGISIRTLRNKLKQYSAEGVAVPPSAADAFA